MAQSNRKPFDREIILSGNEVRIDTLLKIFSSQTGIQFSFTSNKINPSKKLAVPKTSKTLSQWLTILSKTMGIEHKLLGSHVILIDNNTRKGKIPADKEVATPEGKFVTKKPEPSTKKIMTVPDSPADQVENSLVIRNSGAVVPDNTGKDSGREHSDNNLAIKTIPTKKPDSVIQSIDFRTSSQTNNPQNALKQNDIKDETVTALRKPESFQVVIGYSKHGSGDMKGIVFGTEYSRYLSNIFLINYNLRASINSDKHTIIVNNTTTNTRTDASVRFTTAGVQLGVNVGLSLARHSKHEFLISLGGFGRYQSASNGSDGYSIYSPQATGLPVVLVGYDNHTPQETFSVGGLLQVHYNYTLRNKVYFGFIPGFQTDTNGDALPQVALSIGKRF
ncbi:MAG: hypothetical protein H7122_18570 [Chitinophagaceae bacterium]|nr:hypothetical protein [Chitinophagaceae bacterium]